MKTPLHFLSLLAIAALLALPAAAGAEYLIPDGNSAVNQYTEGLPTGGGEKDTQGAGEKRVKPAQTIGAKTTEALEKKGPEGRALAEVAAETAPTPLPVEPDAGIGDSGQGSSQGGDKQPAKDKGKASEAGTNTQSNELVPVVSSGGEGPGGSSGLGEVAAAATGGSGGGIGLLLPLIIVAALAWGVYFAWRRRDGHDPAPSQP